MALAPYHQLLPQLLDPRSELARAREAGGRSVLLIRLADLLEAEAYEASIVEERARALADELAVAVERWLAVDVESTLCFLAPTPPEHPHAAQLDDLTRQLERRLHAFGAEVFSDQEVRERYPVLERDDQLAERTGHVPYTEEYFAALATVVMRRTVASISPPRKVIAVDCDNTLWRGVVGEDGTDGIAIDAGHRALQRRLRELTRDGVLLALVSKNARHDVESVLRDRDDMILREEDVLSWRVNWEPKSANLESLAEELDLGLDSFLFLDDSPLECAEVRQACPQVVVAQIPTTSTESLEEFVASLWPLDAGRVTDVDRLRAASYRANAERAQVRAKSGDLRAFLASLELVVQVRPARQRDVERASQMTQRTNQFNATTLRRTVAEMAELSAEDGAHVLVVDVKDRFGDYGTVGLVVAHQEHPALVVDTFLLSCRALARGVEHRMLAALGELAGEIGATQVVLPCRRTERNEPYRRFYEAVAECLAGASTGSAGSGTSDVGTSDVGTTDLVAPGAEERFSITIDARRAARASVETVVSSADARDEQSEVAAGIARTATRSRETPFREEQGMLWEQIATELATVDQILSLGRPLRARDDLEIHDAPRTPRRGLQETIAGIWSSVLRVEPVGATDRFTDLGGTSLDLVRVHAALCRELRREVELVELFDLPTVEALALYLERDQSSRPSAEAAGRAAGRLERVGERADQRRRAVGSAARRAARGAAAPSLRDARNALEAAK